MFLFWVVLGFGGVFFFFWVHFSINFIVKIVTCKQYSPKNLNQWILVSLVNQWLQCCPHKPGIWSDIKITIYFLAKAGGLVHIILHLKTGKRWNLNSDGAHGYMEGEKNVLLHNILHDTINFIFFKIRQCQSEKEGQNPPKYSPVDIVSRTMEILNITSYFSLTVKCGFWGGQGNVRRRPD